MRLLAPVELLEIPTILGIIYLLNWRKSRSTRKKIAVEKFAPTAFPVLRTWHWFPETRTSPDRKLTAGTGFFETDEKDNKNLTEDLRDFAKLSQLSVTIRNFW